MAEGSHSPGGKAIATYLFIVQLRNEHRTAVRTLKEDGLPSVYVHKTNFL